MTVTNTGDTAGKDVVELYAQSPYTDYDKRNAVEKASVNLVGYGKTSELKPGTSETVRITFGKDQLKAYDYKGAKTYILDAGQYRFTAATDANQAVNNILADKGKTVADGMTSEGDKTMVASWTPENTDVDTTTFASDFHHRQGHLQLVRCGFRSGSGLSVPFRLDWYLPEALRRILR